MTFATVTLADVPFLVIGMLCWQALVALWRLATRPAVAAPVTDGRAMVFPTAPIEPMPTAQIIETAGPVHGTPIQAVADLNEADMDDATGRVERY